jgi:flagellar P-ring protein precursor FlgI
LIGYGLVVGLDGSGRPDHADAVHHAEPSSTCWATGHHLPDDAIAAAEERGGGDGDRQSAAVCPAGQAIDVTVSSMGNAKSLRGGTL